MINPRSIFVISCLSIMVTAMIFSIRADIIGAVSGEYHLNNEMIGLTISSVFWGFTLGIIACAAIVDWIGLKSLHIASGVGYLLGIAMPPVATRSKPTAYWAHQAQRCCT